MDAGAKPGTASPTSGPVRDRLYRHIRRMLGLPSEGMLVCTDPARSFLPIDSVARRIHGDLSTMVIGGLTALFLQTLHPAVMAGVAQHSTFADDPFGRLSRTARFIALTTYGTTAEAETALATITRVHRRVRGVDATGRAFCATDPDLLLWVHATEVYGFLTAAVRYGPGRLTPADQDAYVADMARVALALGVPDPPRSRAALLAYFAHSQGALLFTEDARRTRNFLLRGVRHQPHEVAVYSLLVAAALNLVPRWGRTLLGIPVVPVVGTALVQPAAWSVSWMVRSLTAAGAPS